MTRFQSPQPNRRSVLAGLGFSLLLMSSTALSRPAFAQGDDSFAFDFDNFSARMKDLAAGPHAPVIPEIAPAFQSLDYDAYRLIQYRAERSKWADDPAGYRLQAFHPGWLYTEPVKVFEIEGGTANLVHFGADDFLYHDVAVGDAAQGEFAGVAGLRVNYPLNSPDAPLDELVSFLGASYFRALGRGNIYGASARGLVVNSWIDLPEEFPHFSEFYVEKPEAGGPLTVYAAMESPSVTGAYRFVIQPAHDGAQETTMDVTARLYFRTDLKEVGVAPLTSMFLYAEANRGGFDDYRPQVHDSNGLLVERESGEIMWRALNNSAWLGNSYFAETNPKAFGLYQRGRDFETYQDAGAHYERRPSVRIEPQGAWGTGMVRLIEIPAKLEADDNIVAFWIPAEPALAGESREYSYRVVWGDLDPEDNPAMAYVAETRGGVGGVSGVENAASLRKFVVDFKGGELDALPPGTPLDVLATVGGGVMRNSVLSRVDANGAWRLVMDVETEPGATVELKAYLVGLGRKLTETWLYQWRPNA
ncbi:glucan biosynthesis protein [Devosia rhizoryzae]|nr:glucan biosynthesis protein G [Devosia rhizoryzae]